MSGINDYKITDTTGKKVGDVPGETLSGSVQENKNTFDQLGLYIISHFNGLIDYMRTNIIPSIVALDSIYPVGSIYMSVNSTNPTALFGGTWVRLKDTFLLASGDTYSADSNTYTTAQHGSADATLPQHTHTIEASTSANGAHSHYIYQGSALMGNPPYGGGYFAKSAYASSNYSYALDRNAGMYELKTGQSNPHTHTVTATASTEGSSATNANMPPYLAVYVWKRTA